jgi:hypothetical protein
MTQRMSEAEILEYRSNGIPNDILARLDVIAVLAQKLDANPPEPMLSDLRTKLHEVLYSTEARVRHYYLKRQSDFGIHNLRLKRLLDSFPDIRASFNFSSHPPK